MQLQPVLGLLARAATVVALALAGFVVGYGIGVLLGIAWVRLMGTSSLEGYAAMLVFFGFGPAVAIICALLAAGTYVLWPVLRLPDHDDRPTQPPEGGTR